MAGKIGQKHVKPKDQSKKFPEYYKRLNPHWSDEQCIEAAKQFKKTTNWQCIEYWEAKYPELSHEEHLKLKEEKQNNKKTNNPNYIEYYKKHFPELSNEEHLKMLDKYKKENCYQCEEYYIKRGYSIEEAKKLRNERVKNAGLKIGAKISGEGNGMHSSKRSLEERLSNSPRNIAFYEKRYPELSHEEHLKMQRDFFDLNAKAIKNAIKTTNIEYYLRQGMSEDDARQALHNRQATFSLYKCIEKYGEEKGLEIFNNRQKIWNKKLQKSFKQGKYIQSPIANELFNELRSLLNISNNEEKYIFNDNLHKGYLFDFCLNDKLIEFNGDYWHANPKLYDGNSFIKQKNKKAHEIWEYDKIKIETAKQQGFSVLTIWESDFRENKEETLQKCIEFLNS